MPINRNRYRKRQREKTQLHLLNYWTTGTSMKHQMYQMTWLVSFERINKLNQYEDQNNKITIYYAKNYNLKAVPKCAWKNELIPGRPVPGNESRSWAISLQGAKDRGSEKASEWKGQGAKVPGSELARVLLPDSLPVANWPGSKKAVNHCALQCQQKCDSIKYGMERNSGTRCNWGKL